MHSKSKEIDILKLFFEEPTKHWHFTEIKEGVGIADSKLASWMKKLVRKKIVIKTKKKGRMPFYTANYQEAGYQFRKKNFAHDQLFNSGLLKHLSGLKKTKTVILFGSFNRSDWYKDSDIDIFIYGSSEGLKLSRYETKLRRNIQIINAKNKEELEKLSPKLLRNILRGQIIIGDLNIEIVKNASL